MRLLKIGRKKFSNWKTDVLTVTFCVILCTRPAFWYEEALVKQPESISRFVGVIEGFRWFFSKKWSKKGSILKTHILTVTFCEYHHNQSSTRYQVVLVRRNLVKSLSGWRDMNLLVIWGKEGILEVQIFHLWSIFKNKNGLKLFIWSLCIDVAY